MLTSSYKKVDFKQLQGLVKMYGGQSRPVKGLKIIHEGKDDDCVTSASKFLGVDFANLK